MLDYATAISRCAHVRTILHSVRIFIQRKISLLQSYEIQWFIHDGTSGSGKAYGFALFLSDPLRISLAPWMCCVSQLTD